MRLILSRTVLQEPLKIGFPFGGPIWGRPSLEWGEVAAGELNTGIKDLGYKDVR